MMLLHDEHSELSRTLLATIPEGVTVITGAGGYPASAYPSVVVTILAKEFQVPQYDEQDGLLGIITTGCPEYEEVIRLPASWAAVEAYVAWASRGNT